MLKFFKGLGYQFKYFKGLIWTFWIILFVCIITIIVFFGLIEFGFFGKMPSVKELANYENQNATQLITEDGYTIGRFYNENRVYVEYSHFPQHLVNALLATEDIRFFNHSGIDVRSLGRALFAFAIGKNKGGGSTISQQLAKNLFPRQRFSSKKEIILRKLKEWVIAVKLERNYTKEEIIAFYLNTFDFLNQGVGIKSASNIYFNVEPEDLTLLQSATLVGMAKNPSYFNPKRYKKRTEERRNVVLNQMVKYGYLAKNDFKNLKKNPLVLDFRAQSHKRGLAPYFREYIRLIMTAKKPKLEDYASWAKFRYYEDMQEWLDNPLYGWCEKNKKPNGKNYNIYSDGLTIYSTINYAMQKYAEETTKEYLSGKIQKAFDEQKRELRNPPFSNELVQSKVNSIIKTAINRTQRYKSLKKQNTSEEEINRIFNTKVPMEIFTWSGIRDTVLTPLDSILYYKGFFCSSIMAMEPSTGKVKIYVGGPDYRYFMWDMVTKGKRQVGSTIKPFLYTVAMQEGFTPCDKVLNVPQTILLPNGKSWSPRNPSDRNVGEEVTLKKALATSNNWISAWLVKQYGPRVLPKIIKSLGIRSTVEPVYSNILGISEIYLHEMVSAFSTFANKGVYTKPIFVSRIEDKYGYNLATFSTVNKEIMSEKDAYLMINLMKGVTEYGGTASYLRSKHKFRYPVAGKTGTTQNHSDGWFIGLTPDLVVGTWVGANDRTVHFERISQGGGSRTALPIFALTMKKIYEDQSIDISRGDFEKPLHFSMDILKCEDDKNVNKKKNQDTDSVFIENLEEIL